MLRLSFAILLGAGFLFAAAGHANAAKASKAAQGFIVIKGCAHAAPPFCTIISQGGQTYSLVGANPPVPLNVGVTVVGTPGGAIGICFAQSINVVKWSRNRMRCPKA